MHETKYRLLFSCWANHIFAFFVIFVCFFFCSINVFFQKNEKYFWHIGNVYWREGSYSDVRMTYLSKSMQQKSVCQLKDKKCLPVYTVYIKGAIRDFLTTRFAVLQVSWVRPQGLFLQVFYCVFSVNALLCH